MKNFVIKNTVGERIAIVKADGARALPDQIEFLISEKTKTGINTRAIARLIYNPGLVVSEQQYLVE